MYIVINKNYTKVSILINTFKFYTLMQIDHNQFQEYNTKKKPTKQISRLF
jgi:hypothetical protein